MSYVIKLTENNGAYRAGMYVAPAGSACSYVVRLQDARTFPTREAAQGHCCEGNETVRSVDEEVRP